MSHLLHEMTGAVDEGIPQLFMSAVWNMLNNPEYSHMRSAVNDMDLEDHRTDANDNNVPCHVKYEHCFKCLMKEQDLPERKKRLKKFFNEPGFWDGTTEDWQSNQLLALYDIHNLLFNRETQATYKVKSSQEFKDFLIDLDVTSVFAHIMMLTEPKGEVVNPEWYCVRYYAMSILGALVTPEDIMVVHDRNHKDRKQYEKRANKICASGEVVKTLVSFMKGSREIIEMIRSVFILRSFSKLSDRVCEQIISNDGIGVLVELFTPGHFQKLAAKQRDGGYPKYVKVALSLGIKGWFENTNPFYITEDECFQRTIKRASGVQENSGAVLADIAGTSKDNALLIFESRACVNVTLKWIKHPILIDDFDQNISTSAAQLLKVFLSYRMMATCLVEEKNLLTLLERVMYLPMSWPLDDYAECIKILIEHGGQFIERVARSKKIVFALGCYIHSSTIKLLQDSASFVISKLAKSQPEVLNFLHKKGIVNGLTMAKFEIDEGWEECVRVHMNQIISMAKRYLGKQWLIPKVSTFMPASKKNWNVPLMKERGNKYFKEENYEEAIHHYTQGLIIAHPRNEANVLYSNRAECYLRLNNHMDVIRDCTLSISTTFEESPVYIKTLFRRAKAFHATNRPFEALGDISACTRHSPSEPKFKQLHEEVLKEYRKLTGVVYKIHTCTECQLEGEGMKKCARCNAYFCSQTCQRRAWPTHRIVCRRTKKKSQDLDKDDDDDYDNCYGESNNNDKTEFNLNFKSKTMPGRCKRKSKNKKDRP